MNHEVTIYVKKEEADILEEILAIEEGASPDYGRDEVIRTFTAKFPNGFEADIKVCNGDTPYVDPVLFNQKGNELVVTEIGETLLGQYCFSYEEDTYIVNVKVEEKKNYILVWIEEEEKWYYFVDSFNPEQFQNGYGDYYIEVKDGIITKDTYNVLNEGKSFADVYDITKWEN